jgi:hypothetical protein
MSKISISERFIKNYQGFWRAYFWFIVVFLLALICDAASTIYFMLKDASKVEMHPAVYFVSRIFGPVAGPLLGLFAKAAAGIFVAVYCRKFAVYIFLAAAIISFWAAWYNIWGINLNIPNILKWLPW